MRFAKSHAVGIILGIILYEFYYRSQQHKGA